MASQGGSDASPPLSYCHQCSFEGRPLLQPGPTCPRCGSDFMEEITPSSDLGLGNNTPPIGPDAQPPPPRGGGGASLDIGGVLWNLMSTFTGAASAGNQSQSDANASSRSQPHNSQSGADSPREEGGPRVRSGGGRLGPFGFQYAYMNSNGLGGGSSSSSANSTGRGSSNSNPYHGAYARPDDGMGGAGGGADGRPFDYGSHTTQNENDPFGWAERGGEAHEQPLPPQFAVLRNALVDIFGTADGENEGSNGAAPAGDIINGLFSSFFGAAGGGRMGDYVLGQQGLDDIITQMMEQTQGSTAPPPASEEAIGKLKRLKIGDSTASKLARNRECPTCFDEIIPSTAPTSPTHSRRPSEAAGFTGDAHDDPPEYLPGEEPASDTLVLLPCKHAGHEECIVPWLQRNGTCPICREALEPSATASGSSGQAQQQQEAAGPSAGMATSSQASGRAQSSHNPYTTAQSFGELEDTDEEWEDEEDSPEERRRKTREAAERRTRGSGSEARFGTQEESSRMPGGFEAGILRSPDQDPYDLD
ncbi:hypothetical protein BCV69DRAFT_280537 [Microstroma glucosiphilum]|uniref:RING-type domain-containing protein n=1 Tax=Pseudomicrostroma glucosiphilum TaxID=1684307 RepID=A0A316UDG2_9BASI|nr:hypothetical protein BCV69DRAFT_280537 [Pseudomicrostroma glucosiphilum]PWN22928.1 hypothetical protein BCV69DRAFT_280537 [Pseudomicrostroma glucosiphilum]